MKLLEIGKILRPHGVKGAVKVECFVDEHFSEFKKVFITSKLAKAEVKSVQDLNKDFYIVNLDIIPDIDTAEKFRNQSIYIDREQYSQFSEKVYLSDLIHKDIIDENGNKLGELEDYEDYGAATILTIKCGPVSYQIPYVDDIIEYDADKDAFIIEKKKFEAVRV